MKYFIVDDTLTVRAMLKELIENEGLGTVVGEATDGVNVNNNILTQLGVDILLIDLLMPQRDGIETLRSIMPEFKGKVVMISQVDAKDMVAEAYLLGIEHYITKPINKYEVISVLKKVAEHHLQRQSLLNIQKSLKTITPLTSEPSIVNNNFNYEAEKITSATNNILTEIGLVGEGGYYDLIDIINYLYTIENENKRFQFPSLRELFEQVAKKQCKGKQNTDCFKKEARACEQRVRRTIHQSLKNLASLGLTDYANPTFEYYSGKLFDFSQVRMKMLELEGKKHGQQCRINIKKFIEALYLEAKEKATA